MNLRVLIAMKGHIPEGAWDYLTEGKDTSCITFDFFDGHLAVSVYLYTDDRAWVNFTGWESKLLGYSVVSFEKRRYFARNPRPFWELRSIFEHILEEQRRFETIKELRER